MQLYGTAGPESRATRAGLVLLYAPSFEQFAPAYLLHERDLVIGRETSCGVCVPEAAVSRQHARVHHQGGRWILTDLGGRNGTLVDGAFVHEIALEPLHEIRVGDFLGKMGGVENQAKTFEPFHFHRFDLVRATDPVPQGNQQSCNPAHAGPCDADEVDSHLLPGQVFGWNFNRCGHFIFDGQTSQSRH